MPIYAYRCTTCGHAQDVLQKISDPLLSVCPACGAATYAKQVTAAGFQLKGSGWYVTDFRDNKAKKSPEGEKPGGDKASDGDGGTAKADGNVADKGVGKDSGNGAGNGAGTGTDAPAAASAPAAAPSPAAPASSPSPPSGKSGD